MLAVYTTALHQWRRVALRNYSGRARQLETMQIAHTQLEQVLSPGLTQLAGLFCQHGHELRIAGGAVRDILMEKTPTDIDFATTATPAQMKEMFTKEDIRMINNNGEAHGTITARLQEENFEVTTLRIDKVTDGRRAEVEFTTDWAVDANRRDLTINSMFLGLDGTVYDYWAGAEDLSKRRVRFVGDAKQRIQEDYLRILRYFRFYGRICQEADSHEEETLIAIRNNVAGMERISGERIWLEWKKILSGNFGLELTVKMVEVGLGPYIGLPSQPAMSQYEEVAGRARTMGRTLLPPTQLAALLLDQAEVMRLHARLKLSAVDRDLALFIVTQRHRSPGPHPAQLRPYQFLAVDSKAKLADTRLFIEQLLLYQGEPELANQFAEWTIPRFPVTGTHLKEAGCPPGKIMSVVLDRLKQVWKESGFEAEAATLMVELPAVLDSINPAQLQQAPSNKYKKRRN